MRMDLRSSKYNDCPIYILDVCKLYIISLWLSDNILSNESCAILYSAMFEISRDGCL